ncbi:ECF transporter S component, partial [Peptococcaceae bacterium]|nr:ECF transporter S component [Peptococcaceae bacterium]
FAVLLLGATYLFTIFIMPLGPLAMFAVSGLWLIPPIFIAYILRRSGAALLTQAMISLITAYSSNDLSNFSALFSMGGGWNL